MSLTHIKVQVLNSQDNIYPVTDLKTFWPQHIFSFSSSQCLTSFRKLPPPAVPTNRGAMITPAEPQFEIACDNIKRLNFLHVTCFVLMTQPLSSLTSTYNYYYINVLYFKRMMTSNSRLMFEFEFKDGQEAVGVAVHNFRHDLAVLVETCSRQSSNLGEIDHHNHRKLFRSDLRHHQQVLELEYPSTVHCTCQ